MTLQQLGGMSAQWPYQFDWQANYSGAALGTALLMDAATEKVAFVGRVWFPSRSSTKAIRKIHFRCGAVTLNAASSFRVSLQDVSTASTFQPDGTPDENWTTNTLTANGWNTSGALSGDRTVSFGEALSVVFDFATFTAADSIIISGVATSASTAGSVNAQGAATLFSGSWAVSTTLPILVLEFSDGTFGTFYGCCPASALPTIAWSNSAGDDARGLEFSLPIPFKMDGVWVVLTPAGSSSDFIIEVWDGTSVIANGQRAVDITQVVSTSTRRYFVPLEAEISGTANTTYRVTVRPTTANNITLGAFDLNDAAHRVCFGGTTASYNTKTDGGAWGTATTTRIPMIALSLSAFDDGAGAGGGGGPLIGGRLIR